MDANSSVGYIRLKEFNALAKKDLVTGNYLMNSTAQCVKFLTYIIPHITQGSLKIQCKK